MRMFVGSQINKELMKGIRCKSKPVAMRMHLQHVEKITEFMVW